MMASAFVPHADRTNDVTFSQPDLPKPPYCTQTHRTAFPSPRRKGRGAKKPSDAKPYINVKYSALKIWEDNSM